MEFQNIRLANHRHVKTNVRCNARIPTDIPIKVEVHQGSVLALFSLFAIYLAIASLFSNIVMNYLTKDK